MCGERVGDVVITGTLPPSQCAGAGGAESKLALGHWGRTVRLVLLLVRLARSEQTVRVLTRDAVGNFPGNGRGAVGRGPDRAAVQLVAEALVDRVRLALEVVDGRVELVVHLG